MQLTETFSKLLLKCVHYCALLCETWQKLGRLYRLLTTLDTFPCDMGPKTTKTDRANVTSHNNRYFMSIFEKFQSIKQAFQWYQASKNWTLPGGCGGGEGDILQLSPGCQNHCGPPRVWNHLDNSVYTLRKKIALYEYRTFSVIHHLRLLLPSALLSKLARCLD